MSRFQQFLTRNPILALSLLWCLVVVLSIPPVLGFSGFDLLEPPDERWASESDRELLSEVEQHFDNRLAALPVMLVLECDNFFQRPRVAAVRRAAEWLRHIGNRDRPVDASRTETEVIWIDSIQSSGLSLFGSESLWPPDDASEETLAEARDLLREHPLIAGQFLSMDGQTMLVGLVSWDESLFDEIREIAAEELEPVGIRMRITGPMPLWNAHRHAFDEDHHRILIIACALVVGLALIIFRGLPAIIVACSGPAVGVLWAEGWLMLLGQDGNDLSQVIVPVMVLMIGFTDAVHFVVHIRQQKAAGNSSIDAALASVKHVGLACLLTSLTTAIGFLSLLIADSEIIHGFGRAAAIGVSASFMAVLFVVPLTSCTWVGRWINRGYERDLVGRNMTRLSSLTDVVVKHARLVGVIGILLTAGLAMSTFKLQPDDRFSHRVPTNSEARRAMDHCDRVLGGIRFMQIVVRWSERNSNDEIWQVLDECESLLDNEPLISAPVSIRKVMEQVPGLHGPLKLSMTGLIPDRIRHQFWQSETRRAQVLGRMQDLGSARYESVFRQIEEDFRGIEAEHPGFRLILTGDAVVTGRMLKDVVRELFQGLLLASLIIFFVITLAFRSCRFGLLSIVPNIFPLAATAFFRAAIDNSLDISSACSFSVCLGIAVDDTIHFLTRYRYERDQGHDVATSIRGTFVTVGSALVMTTVVMVAGFASVMTSQLPTHFLFASMACTTIGAALLGDLILLPALLALFPDRDVEPKDV